MPVDQQLEASKASPALSPAGPDLESGKYSTAKRTPGVVENKQPPFRLGPQNAPGRRCRIVSAYILFLKHSHGLTRPSCIETFNPAHQKIRKRAGVSCSYTRVS